MVEKRNGEQSGSRVYEVKERQSTQSTTWGIDIETALLG